MGNCLTSNKIVAQDENHEPPSEAEVIKQATELAPSKLKPTKRISGDKKMVRFKLHKEGDVDRERHGESKGEVMRIRVVVTKEELKQIMTYKTDFKYSSVEQLLIAMKSRGRLVSDVETSDGGINGSWRPALESIPEDH